MKRVFLNAEARLRNIWWVVIFFLLLAVMLFPILLLADQYNFELTYWHQVILIVIATLAGTALKRESFFAIIGMINLTWFRQLAIGFALGSVLMLVPALLLTLTGSLQWSVNRVIPISFITGITVMLAAVLAEELLFRGFIFKRFMEAFGQWPAQLIIAALFLLTHLGNPGLTGIIKTFASINIFIASILFGITYIKTKCIAMPIGIHFMANVVQGNILGFGVSGESQNSLLMPTFHDLPAWLTGGTFGLEASAAGLLTIISLSIIVYRRMPGEN